MVMIYALLANLQLTCLGSSVSHNRISQYLTMSWAFTLVALFEQINRNKRKFRTALCTNFSCNCLLNNKDVIRNN